MSATATEHPNDPRFLYFSSQLGRPVVGSDGQPVGRLADLLAATGEAYPPIDGIVVRAGCGRRLQLPWTAVAELGPRRLKLKAGAHPRRSPRVRRPTASGWLRRSSTDRSTYDEAKQFYWLYSSILAIGALVVLIPKLPLVRIMLVSQIVNGVLLPFILVFMLILVNREKLMGEYRNGRWLNAIAWATTLVMIALTVYLVIAGVKDLLA
jgi:hypothetical protein